MKIKHQKTSENKILEKNQVKIKKIAKNRNKKSYFKKIMKIT